LRYNIESTQNSTFKIFTELLTGAGIRKHGQALLFGEKIITDTLKNVPHQCLGLISRRASSTPLPKLTHYHLSETLFDKLDLFNTGSEILLTLVPQINILDLKSPTDVKKLKNCSLMIPFQEPSNVGAILRSAAAFGVKNILLSEGCAHPFLPKSSRAASGNLFHFNYFQIPSLKNLEWLKDISIDVSLISLDFQGEGLSDFKFPPHFILCPGSEGEGLPINFPSTRKIKIPMSQGVESLNGAVATSIALYQWFTSVGVRN
jgi:TrmH family RNA methyltransferase